jgi:hypothetical protein
MALQSQLGTANSALASTMSLGVVLGGGPPILNKSASSTLTLTDIGHAIISEQTASSTISFTSNVVHALFSGSPNLESVLAFTQNAHAARNLPVGVSHTINFVSLGGRTLTGAPANTLSLAQVVIEVNYVGDRKPAGNVLNLVQTVTTLSDISVTHDLGLTDVAVGQGPIKPDLTSFLGLSQHVSTPYHMWVSHDLGIADFLNTPLPLQVVTHTLNFVSESPIGGITSTLNLSDSATYAFSLTAANLMTLVDVMSVEGIWIRNVSQVLGIGHSLTWYEDTPCGRKQYTPFQGDFTSPPSGHAPAKLSCEPRRWTTETATPTTASTERLAEVSWLCSPILSGRRSAPWQ